MRLFAVFLCESLLEGKVECSASIRLTFSPDLTAVSSNDPQDCCQADTCSGKIRVGNQAAENTE